MNAKLQTFDDAGKPLPEQQIELPGTIALGIFLKTRIQRETGKAVRVVTVKTNNVFRTERLDIAVYFKEQKEPARLQITKHDSRKDIARNVIALLQNGLRN